MTQEAKVHPESVECHCGCHDPANPPFRHFVPCCQGVCPHCNKWFKSGLKEHVVRCGKAAVAATAGPSQDEVAALPRWAQVALAAHCARLVLPLYRPHVPDESRVYRGAVERAVVLAEECAARAEAPPPHGPDDPVVLRPDVAAGRAADAGLGCGQASYHAAQAAADAADAAGDYSHRPPAVAAWSAVSQAVEAAAHAARTAGPPLLTSSAARSAYNHLAAMSSAARWDDSTAVPTSVFNGKAS